MVYLLLILSLAQALRKYPLTQLEDSNEVNGKGKISEAQGLFSIQLKVGNPPQNITAVICMSQQKEIVIPVINGKNENNFTFFNISNSSTYSVINSKGTFKGKSAVIANETIAFDDIKVEGQKFFIVDINDSPNQQNATLPLYFDINGDSTSFLNSIFSNQSIDDYSFTIDLYEETLLIGEIFNPNDANDPIVYVDIDPLTWTTYLEMIEVNFTIIANYTLEENQKTPLDAAKVNFAIEYPYITGPEKEIDEILSLIKHDKNCNDNICACDEVFTGYFNFTITFNNQTISVEPHSYLALDNGNCTILITKGTQWTFGLPFFREFLGYFNFKNNTAVFFRHPHNEGIIRSLIIIICSMALAILFMGFIFMCTRYLVLKKNEQRENENRYNRYYG
ncbi:hypothetical protein SteCoe_13298 [Stentor coeruleus]|uniref:Peptidase A1 domain-containing protein n=1 Tax=Stentor coeruleus TaxID=5963 RepID=A0A1R2C4V6_9CILI|nr:hypothetical protein SteCoe_15010 [Stentor coeruleus]OMJ85388.1 hypothetical protein SteCoe_13298 [Stentor coeruleus]